MRCGFLKRQNSVACCHWPEAGALLLLDLSQHPFRNRMQCHSYSYIGKLARLRASTFIAECCRTSNCNQRLTLPPSASSAAEMQSDGASQADLVDSPARNSCAAACLRRRNRTQCRSQPWIGALVRSLASAFIAECCKTSGCNQHF